MKKNTIVKNIVKIKVKFALHEALSNNHESNTESVGGKQLPH